MFVISYLNHTLDLILQNILNEKKEKQTHRMEVENEEFIIIDQSPQINSQSKDSSVMESEQEENELTSDKYKSEQSDSESLSEESESNNRSDKSKIYGDKSDNSADESESESYDSDNKRQIGNNSPKKQTRKYNSNNYEIV